jgi:hypothetical protein
MERARYLAQAEGVEEEVLAYEVAELLLDVAHDPAEMVAAARRVLAHQAGCPALVWLCAHMLVSLEPAQAASECLSRLERQDAARKLAESFDESVSVLVVGDGAVTAAALRRRGDIDVSVLTTPFVGHRLRASLEHDRVVRSYELELVSIAVRRADLVIVEPQMIGPSGGLYALGTAATCALASNSQIELWCVVGEGRALPDLLYESALGRMEGDVDNEAGMLETCANQVMDRFVSAAGVDETITIDCPVAGELGA